MLKTFTLRLTLGVGKYLLADIRALLPAESVQFFSNELDEEWHYTLLCIHSDHSCSLIVSAILVWLQLKRIRILIYRTATEHQDVSQCSADELFHLLSRPGAVLYLS
ncbi:hypothetical protein [Erwinia psidii]|uniref:Uncharacterized protein n=1 Tax=Erwinia psidii TaxID=69224 RepID=A0A3N6SEY7_9GAMM|nr:hypothetical protein [Erwinia psidii]MCX8956681.1 hypothetical protein [Erwinia psidii]MCX8960507.1 hypothetical protein [Erwinia psidii]RQM40010.1 hypothetical protein EB241_01520 [Erwinia psidii]